ncbi:MAG: beta-propeller domain-containing protein [Candidatus Woesearchaeota archaeon]|nr:MAG: beta-propeller domain-containing protein [Candidatus Woesearchaeota archaeon]
MIKKHNGIKKTLLLAIPLLVVIIALSACTLQDLGNGNNNYQEDPELIGLPNDGLQKFASIAEAQAYLQAKQLEESGSFSSPLMSRGGMMETAALMDAQSSLGKSVTVTMGGSTTPAYSETNVQVSGVDEPDIIKTDGNYLYTIANNKLVIVDATTPQEPELVSETPISEDTTNWRSPRATELFVNGDYVVVFVSSYEQTVSFSKYDIYPQESYRQMTIAYIFDASEKSDPQLVQKVSATGNFQDARMIGDTVYFIAQEYSWNGNGIAEPFVSTDVMRIAPAIYYFDSPETNYNFATIVSFAIASQEVIDVETLMVGYDTTLMMTENNLYLATRPNNWWGWRQGYGEERFNEVILPRLPAELKTQINQLDADLTEDERWQEISLLLGAFFEKAATDDSFAQVYEEVFGDIEEALLAYDTEQALAYDQTQIHKFGLANGKLSYAATGSVPGSLLNQFSLDEYEGNLRVATTINIWVGERIVTNNVFVLDEDLNLVGDLRNLARDQSIFAARFLGDRLYLVTFERTDPLFVIDLSDATNPNVLGELHMPGFSSYLHPYDENLIIGVGRDGDEEGRLGGIKLALYDVSDVANPVEKDVVVIGDQGSSSPVLDDHHAFLFDKEKNLLVLPVAKVTAKIAQGQYAYRYTMWHGAYVFDVDETGFTQKGTIQHGSSSTSYYYWRDSATVLRGLYIDDVLYTLSTKYLKANDLETLEPLASLSLPQVEEFDREEFVGLPVY